MAEPHPDDINTLGKEIDRLWAKVASSSASSLDFDVSATTLSSDPARQELAWETVALLKKQHRDDSRHWSEIIESKEKLLRGLRERLAIVEGENNALKGRLRTDEVRLLEEGTKVQAQLEAAMGAFEADRRRFDQEQSSLRALLEQTRQRLATEDSRWKAEQRQWEKKEQQYLMDLRDLQATVDRIQQESGQSSDEARKLQGSLKEAKNALEKTLAELLRERQVRQQSEQEREKAAKKVDEVENHLTELSRLWDEERAQWRELWDRERSTWETQRQEFAGWEERLRKERQAWHAELESKEKDQLRFTEQMTRALRDTSELSTRVGAMLKGGYPAFWVPFASPRLRRAALAALFAFAAVWPAWRYARRPHFKVVATQTVAVASPTAVVFDGTLLWLADWDGRLAAYDPNNLNALVKGASPVELGAYRPVSLAFGGEYLWSLDTARARVVRHQASDPRMILATRPAPGPAPTAAAFDGTTLWSYDAANRTLYQHGGDEGTTRSFALSADLVVTAMAWVKGRLWVYDSKTRRLVDFDYKNGVFRERDRYPFEDAVIGMAKASALVDGRRREQLWVLVGPSGERSSPAIVRYKF